MKEKSQGVWEGSGMPLVILDLLVYGCWIKNWVAVPNSHMPGAPGYPRTGSPSQEGETFPSSLKLQDTEAGQQICLLSLELLPSFVILFSLAANSGQLSEILSS